MLTAFLDVMSGIRCQCLRDNKERIGERSHTVFRLALRLLAESFAVESGGTGNLKGPRAGDDALVDDHVVHATEPVSDGVLDLGNRMGIWAFYE